jgi:hypothetical protein
MKKIVLFLILFVQMSWAQAPIVKFDFNGNLNSTNGSNTLNTNPGYSGTISYTNDRFGQANSACVLPTNVTANLSAVLTNLPQGNSNRTVSVWVKNINYPNNALINVFQYGNNTVNQSYRLGHQGISFDRLFVSDGVNTYVSDNNKAAIYPGGWYHYVAIHENSTLKIYVNGLLVFSQSNVTLATQGSTFTLNSGTSAYANSQLHYDDLEIYDIALTESQIQNKYAAESPLDTNQLVAYFGFNNSLTAQNNSSLQFTTSNATPYTTGYNGQGLNFQLSTPASMPFQPSQLNNNNFTISFWNKRSGNPTFTYDTMFEAFGSLYFRDGTANASAFTNFGFNYGGNNWQNVQINRWVNNEWVHYAATFEPTTGNATIVKWYRNGILVYEQNIGSGVLNQSFENFITLGGGLSGNGSGSFLPSKNASNMQLDELYIYNRALTQAQIMALRYQVPASCPTGNVTVTTQAQLNALAGCTTINGNLQINGSGITDFTPVNNITTVTGELSIINISTNLNNVFPNLTSAGAIAIINNSFTTFNGFNSLTGNLNYIGIGFNNNLTTFSGFNTFSGTTSLDIRDNPNLNTINALGSVTQINNFYLKNVALANLDFLSSLTTINGFFIVELCSSLNSFSPTINKTLLLNNSTFRLSGLPLLSNLNGLTFNSANCSDITIMDCGSLTSISPMSGISGAMTGGFLGNIFIQNNDALTSLNGLQNITSARSLFILDNQLLTNLNGLNSFSSTTDAVGISDNPSLTTLNGLNNLVAVGYPPTIVNNPMLTDISALNTLNLASTLNMASGQLNITNNSSLATCAVPWVCNYMSNANVTKNINSNAVGCESVAAINSACTALSVDDIENDMVRIYPNPASTYFNVQVTNKLVSEIYLYDVLGKEILKTNQTTISVDGLNKGIYFVKIKTDNESYETKKLIIK